MCIALFIMYIEFDTTIHENVVFECLDIFKENIVVLKMRLFFSIQRNNNKNFTSADKKRYHIQFS